MSTVRSVPLWKRWLAIFTIFNLFINSAIAQVNLDPTPQPWIEFLSDSTWTAEWSGHVVVLIVAGGGGGGGRSGGGGGGGGVVQAKYYVEKNSQYSVIVGAGEKPLEGSPINAL